MEYRNKKTGAIINVTCSVTSEYWEPVEEIQPAPVSVVTEDETEKAPLKRVKKVK